MPVSAHVAGDHFQKVSKLQDWIQRSWSIQGLVARHLIHRLEEYLEAAALPKDLKGLRRKTKKIQVEQRAKFSFFLSMFSQSTYNENTAPPPLPQLVHWSRRAQAITRRWLRHCWPPAAWSQYDDLSGHLSHTREWQICCFATLGISRK